MRAVAARSRALMATGQAAEAEFHAALTLHAEDGAPLEQARTQLLFGQFLRRERRRSDSRPHLRSAMTNFERLGAAAWADVARHELQASGDNVTSLSARPLDQLTPQETRIVVAISKGSTNREIAARMFLSQRTVDHHLRKIFPKLGVSSRADLIRYALDAYADTD